MLRAVKMNRLKTEPLHWNNGVNAMGGGASKRTPQRDMMQKWQAEANAAKHEAHDLDAMLTGLRTKWQTRAQQAADDAARERERHNAEAYAARMAAEQKADADEENEARRVVAARKAKLALDRRNDRLQTRTAAYCERYFGGGDAG